MAEKLHAMVVLGESNSRLKDFYDLHVLASQFDFDGPTLVGSIEATFERRRMLIDATVPIALTPRFFVDPGRARQWRAYLTRNSLPGAPADFDEAGERLQAFLGPVWQSIVANAPFAMHWPAGGPWGQAATAREGNAVEV